MSDWLGFESDLDAAMLDAFAEPVVLHLPGGDHNCQGVFDDNVERRDLRGGGYIQGTQAEVCVSNLDVVGVEMRQLVTIRGRQWRIVQPPEPEGIETTKLILGADDGQQSGQPDIRY